MHTKQEKTVKMLAKSSEIKESEMLLIDEYFINGFNKMKAGRSIKSGSSDSTVNNWVSEVFNKPAVKKYYDSKVAALRAESHVENTMILKELLSFAYSDITTFIGLSPEELKALPQDIRRCISSIDTTTKSWLDPKNKQVVKETTVKIKLMDKLKAIDMIGKHIDFFNADNRSKGGTIDLTKATNDQLNTVLELISSQKSLNIG